MAGTGSGRFGRVTLFLLVLNLLALAIGFGMEHFDAGRAPVLNEFNAGKIRFWSQPDSYKPSAPAALKPAEEIAKPAVENGLCLEIADLSQAHYQEMRTLLKSAGLDGGQCVYSFDKKLAWWVFWPPEYEAVQRDKAIKAIQAAGVKDVLPITQGAMAQAFSLGVFTGETQANQHRDALRGKGLDKVEHGPRPSMGSGRLGCMADASGKLGGFRAGLPAWVKPVETQLCGLAAGQPAPASDGAKQPPR